MKTLLIAAIVVCALPGVCPAQESSAMKWTRRALTAAACAASLVDGVQSAKYLDGAHGLTEGNVLLRNSDGTVNLPRLALFKAPICAIPAIIGESAKSSVWKLAATAAAAVALSIFLGVDVHNESLIRTH